MKAYDSQGNLRITGAGGGGAGSVNISAGTTSNLLTAVTFSDSNGISFGINASTITAAHNAITSQSVQTQSNVQGIIVSNTTYRTGDVSFSNLNGISFGSNGANVVTASYTVPTQTNQTGGIYVTAQSTGQSSSSTYDLRTLSFVPDGIISAGWSGGSFRVSATQSNQAFSAAGGSSAFQTLSFADTNSVSFTNTNGSIGVASVKLQMFAVSNTTQSSSGTANHTALSFGGAGAVSVGVTGGSVVVSAPNTIAQTNQTGGIYVTAQSTGQSSSSTYDLRTLSFIPDGIISAGWSGGSFRISATQSAQTQSNVQGIIVSNTTYRTGDVSFSNLNGISFGSNGANVITASYTVPVAGAAITVSDAATSGTIGRLAFTNLNGVTLSLSTGAAGSHTIVGSHNALTSQSNQAFSAAGGSSAFQTLNFADINSVSFTNTGGSVAVASVKLQMFAVSNTTQNTSGTANHTAISFGGAGIASVGVTGGSVVISVPSGGGAGDGGVFAGVSSDGNTAGSTGTVSTGNFVLVGSNNITLSQSTGAAGSAATVTVLGPTLFSAGMSNLGNTAGTSSLVASQIVFVGTNGILLSQSNNGNSATISIGNAVVLSSYQNINLFGVNTALVGLTGATSHCIAFNLPQDGSFSFLRLAVRMSTGSTTIATIASNTATASASIASTVNAVIYSLATGASSLSLNSVASGSAGYTFSQQISITNSTQYSISQGISAQANGAGTSRSTQYSISNTNYSFTTNQIATAFSADRFLDVPFGNSLTAGAYWLILGISTNSASGGAAGLAAMSNCFVRTSSYFGANGMSAAVGVMGSTNLTSGGNMGNGDFSTAGGGTTNGLPISAISSGLLRPIMQFQLLRSA